MKLLGNYDVRRLPKLDSRPIEIEMTASLRLKVIYATLSGNGLHWSKPLSEAKQVISYEAWLRVHNHPASLDLLDEYIAQMKAAAEH